MTNHAAIRLKLGAVLLLSAALVSCSATPPDAVSSIPPTNLETAVHTDMPIAGPADGDAAPDRFGDPAPLSSAPEASPDPSAPAGGQAGTSDEEESDPSDAAEASKLDSPPPKADSAKESTYNPKAPSLANVKLGDSDKTIVKKYGLPIETYPLPGDDRTIVIWEYDGLSVGFDEAFAVVYVEVYAETAKTNIRGLKLGMDGADAAKLLGIPIDGMTNVLTAKVAGGWMKIDLDPDSRAVLTIRLLTPEGR
ncbi:hypothetical protein ACFPPD_15140 [Cohnella suwonensis]|uniref:Lipoprotein n=1 Tax=Cohnella suwonensis TaxID=696072 RepID=A0ABW0LXQ7_9BACL